MDLATLRRTWESAGEGHVFRFFDSLDPAGKQKLQNQLQQFDPRHLSELASQYVTHKPPINIPKDIQPVKAFPREPLTPDQRKLYDDARRRGQELLSAGKIAAFLVAGGQGTRLGYDGPKGEFPVTPVRHKPLFQVFAEQIRAYSRDFGKTVPWYIMTSEANDTQTRAFFQQHNYFGLNAYDVFFFQQGMIPAFAMDGRVLLGERDSLALSPDGHGGSLRALSRSGALADMRRRGIEHLSYFQVDNPLVHVVDPLFLGLHDLTTSEMSSKTIPKAGPLEKVGNFVQADGVVQVIEYSDLPEELARQTNSDGGLRFNEGSIAIHALRVSFVERLNSTGTLSLPWHRAEKKVPYVDEQGNPVKPDKPNAVKLEQFVFDAIPLAKNAMVYTTDRAEEFSPVKNAEGVDSPATCRRDQIRRSARWLRAAGVQVPEKNGEPDATLEISPLLAVSAEQLRQRNLTVRQIAPGSSLYLDEAAR
ncbi:MAG TPA: UDPGP type 1 family protein [Tepidisphaeraceae bacterium]|nr:UDPGP type 1 family protein [Tepidisphaeraceae bacterium]